jgi:hypothetical protein
MAALREEIRGVNIYFRDNKKNRTDAKIKIWLEYNEIRPHSSLRQLTPIRKLPLDVDTWS